MVEFRATKDETELIMKIITRALKMDLGLRDRLSLEMDIEAVHSNGCPLRLEDLLNAPENDFGHDVLGIVRYIDRTTGHLTDCFVPRCAMPEFMAEAWQKSMEEYRVTVETFTGAKS